MDDQNQRKKRKVTVGYLGEADINNIDTPTGKVLDFLLFVDQLNKGQVV